MVWIIVLSALLATIITVILITAYRAKKTESGQSGTSTRSNVNYQRIEEPDCCKNCDYSKELSNNKYWCDEHKIYVNPIAVCPYYRGLIREMAEQIVKFNNL